MHDNIYVYELDSFGYPTYKQRRVELLMNSLFAVKTNLLGIQMLWFSLTFFFLYLRRHCGLSEEIQGKILSKFPKTYWRNYILNACIFLMLTVLLSLGLYIWYI